MVRLYLRSVDRIYRIKDSEFIVLLPETPTEGARVAIDRIRTGLKNPKKAGTGSITITTALVTFPSVELKTAKDILNTLNRLLTNNPEDQIDHLIELP